MEGRKLESILKKWKIERITKRTIDEHFAKSVETQDEFLELWVLMGANVNINYGQALASATKESNLEMMKLLLTHGANPRNLGDYAIKIALKNNDFEALKLLCKYVTKNTEYIHVPEEIRFDSKKSILQWYDYSEYGYDSVADLAVKTNNIEIAKYILQHEVNFDDGSIFYAVIETKNLEMLKLVNSFARYKLKEKDLKYYAQSILKTNSVEMVKYFINEICGGSLPIGTFNGDLEVSIIGQLASKGYSEILQFLMNLPVDKLGVKKWKNQLDYAFYSAICGRQLGVMKLLYTEESLSWIIEKKNIVDIVFFYKEGRDNLYEVIEWLLSCEILAKKEGLGNEFMIRAVEINNIALIKLLKQYNVECSKEALEEAVHVRSREAIEYLLKTEQFIINEEKIKEWINRHGYDTRKDKDFEIINMLCLISSKKS